MGKFYDITNIAKLNCQYNFLLSGRNQGKSYQVKHKVVKDAFEDENNKFVYLRRYGVEMGQNGDVEQYFKNVDVPKVTKKKWQFIVVQKKKIYLAKWDIKRKKIKTLDKNGNPTETIDEWEERLIGPQIGYIVSLTESLQKKSLVYEDVENVVYEEFLTKGDYLHNEPDLLQELISTIARNRIIKVWLIANTVTRLNPYIRAWGLFRVNKQEPGTIDVYEHHYNDVDGNDMCITIAVEMIVSNNEAGTMAVGSYRNAIISGHWTTYPAPHLPEPIEHYTICHKIYFSYLDIVYLAYLLQDKEHNYFWYVKPGKERNYKASNGKIYKNDYPDFKRRITDYWDFSNYHTQKLIPINQKEQFAINLLNIGKICYSDDLTGTEFPEVLKSFR